MWTQNMLFGKQLTLQVPFTKMVALMASVDQDHAAQYVQPDLRSTLSVVLKHYRQKVARNLQLTLSYCRLKMSIRFIRHFNPFPNDKF